MEVCKKCVPGQILQEMPGGPAARWPGKAALTLGPSLWSSASSQPCSSRRSLFPCPQFDGMSDGHSEEQSSERKTDKPGY